MGRRAVGVIILIAGLASPAFADDKAKAAAHYKQGNAFRNAKQYDKAIVEFEAAYAIDKLPIHLFNIADAYLAKKDLDKAIEYYQRYLVADPATKRGAEVRGLIAALTQQKADADAKKKADDEAARLAAETKRLEDEQAAKKVGSTAHVKQAEAYQQAGAWTKAGDEHRAAFAIDGDVAHLLAAAAAYRKQDLPKARDAYLAYLEKVPLGAESDKIRGEVATITREIEKAEAEQRAQRLRQDEQRAADERRRQDRLVVVAPPPAAKPRRTSIGAELRGGLYSTGSFVTQMPFFEVKNTPGPAFGVAAFVDFPLFTASNIHVGVRERSFKSGFTDRCGSLPTSMCPSKVSGAHIGPALTLQPSIFHRGRFDVYSVVGYSFMVPIKEMEVSFTDGSTRKLKQPLSELEFGIGGRLGSVSVNATFQLSTTTVGGLGTDLGHTSGLLVAAGWTLPR